MTFKVGDRVRYIEDGDEGLVTNINSIQGWISVEFDEDGNCNMLAEDLEIVTGDEEPPLAPWEKELLWTPFEQNVRRTTDGIADLLIAKNKAYGDSALNPIRVFSKSDRIEGLYQRIDDKLSRVSRGTDYPGDDTVKDLIGYLCLLLIARESE